MLISPYPMLLHARFEMRLKVPGQDGNLRCIDLIGTCQWTREDVTPGSFDSGFRLIDPPADIGDMIDALKQYFSFSAPSAGTEARQGGGNHLAGEQGGPTL